MLDTDLMTYQDVAQRAKVDPRTVQRWVKRLNLRVVRPTKCTVRLPGVTVQKLIGTTYGFRESLKRLEKASIRPT